MIQRSLTGSDGTPIEPLRKLKIRGLVGLSSSGTVRVKKKVQVRLDRLTFAEIAEITESGVISGHESGTCLQ